MDTALLIIGVFALVAGWRVKSKKEIGWFGFGYVALVVFIVSFFAVILTSALISKGVEFLDTYISNGTLSLLEFSGELIIMSFGLFIMWLALFLAFVGMVLYVFGVGLKKYFKLIQNIAAYFFIPLLMIGFEALLIYAFLYRNEIPTFATAILLFFILILGLSIWAYIKMTFFSKAKLKWRKTDVGSWAADWEVECGEDGANEKLTVSKKKKLVPLNEEYLKKTDNYRKK